jgi:hypothetical protein
MATTNQMPKTITQNRPRRGQPAVPVQVLAKPTVLPFARGVQLPRAGALVTREVNRNRGTRTSTARGSHVALRTRKRTVVA